MKRSERRPRPGGDRGFTLVELLVVIGIIAIFTGMLMPALSKARADARLVQCRANLTNMYKAAILHMHDHRGFLPVAGWHWDPPGGVVNPHGLRDDDASRYIYYEDAGIRRPAPITVALAVSLGSRIRLDSRQNLEQDMERPDLRKLFKCPSQEVDLRGLTQKSSEPWEAPRDWSSYVFNEAVLGMREKTTNRDPLLGRMFRVKHPTIVMFAMDGRPRDQGKDNWLMVPDKTPHDSVWDFHERLNEPDDGHGKELFDYPRHRYRANVVFMDGHVECVAMTRAGLDAVGVSKGVRD